MGFQPRHDSAAASQSTRQTEAAGAMAQKSRTHVASAAQLRRNTVISSDHIAPRPSKSVLIPNTNGTAAHSSSPQRTAASHPACIPSSGELCEKKERARRPVGWLGSPSAGR